MLMTCAEVRLPENVLGHFQNLSHEGPRYVVLLSQIAEK